MRIASIETFVVRVPLNDDDHRSVADSGASSYEPSVQNGRYLLVDQWEALYPRHAESFLVKVTCDDGSSGWGEAQAALVPEVLEVIVREVVAPSLIGTSPFRPAVHWSRWHQRLEDRGHTTSFAMDALAAVDIALWDLMGQIVGRPAHELLGGQFRSRLKVYWSGLNEPTLEGRLAAASAAIDRGVRGVKLHVRGTPEEDIHEVATLRELAGSDLAVMVDAHWKYSLAEALRVGRELDRLGVAWFETPIRDRDLAGQAVLGGALDLPIAYGEPERTRFHTIERLRSRAAGLILVDVGRTGLLEGRRICDLADLHNVPVATHGAIGLGVFNAAAVQLAAAAPNLTWYEYQPRWHEVGNRILREDIVLDDGYISVPEAPGIGVQVDEEQVRRYAVASEMAAV